MSNDTVFFFFRVISVKLHVTVLKEYVIVFWQDAAEPTTQEELERRLKKLEKVIFLCSSTKTNNSFNVCICSRFFSNYIQEKALRITSL